MTEILLSLIPLTLAAGFMVAIFRTEKRIIEIDRRLNDIIHQSRIDIK